MSVIKESYYKLVKISDLTAVNRNTFIQIIGKIILYDKTNEKIQIYDSFGTHTIDLGKNKDFNGAAGQVIRVFGNYDGIKIIVEKIIDWSIPPEKIAILFSGS